MSGIAPDVSEGNPIHKQVISSYRSLTFITTYQCTAACKECCFECSPDVNSGKLTFDFMSKAIDDAIRTMPNLEIVVFSGGECFMLKDHLYQTIAYATSHGLKTRCVTNGYWGVSEKTAKKIAGILRQAGLFEINISTGLDHQKWVQFASVANCAKALVAEQIPTLITVEKDTSESRCWNEANANEVIKNLLLQTPKRLTLICNTWMPFKTDPVGRGDVDNSKLDGGCHQLFSNLVITPHRVVSACCGLTFEHIPEMRLGKYESKPLEAYIDEIAEDFLKLWIHLDGPRQVARAVLGEESNSKIEDSIHICQACAVLHQDKRLRDALQKRYHEFVPDVVGRFLVNKMFNEMAQKKETTNRTLQVAVV